MLQLAKRLPFESKKDNEAAQNRPEAEAHEMLLVSPTVAAKMLGLTRRQLWSFHAVGKVPDPIYLGHNAALWRVEELRAWVSANCPDRLTWQKIKTTRPG